MQYVIDNEEIPMVRQYKHLDKLLEFHRCRIELGDMGVGKLMASLVETTMLYESEICGCNWDLEKIDQVQMRALRLFLGVVTLQLNVSLLAEMGDLLQVKWLARMRGVIFWGKALTSRRYDGWLLSLGGRMLMWRYFKELSSVEVRETLEAIAWRKVQEEWDQEMETKPKLETLKRIVKLGEWLEGRTGVCR